MLDGVLSCWYLLLALLTLVLLSCRILADAYIVSLDMFDTVSLAAATTEQPRPVPLRTWSRRATLLSSLSLLADS